MPTIYYQVENIQIKGYEFCIWDCEGKALWKHYLPGTNGVIFVVDSYETDHIEEAGEELKKLLT